MMIFYGEIGALAADPRDDADGNSSRPRRAVSPSRGARSRGDHARAQPLFHLAEQGEALVPRPLVRAASRWRSSSTKGACAAIRSPRCTPRPARCSRIAMPSSRATPWSPACGPSSSASSASSSSGQATSTPRPQPPPLEARPCGCPPKALDPRTADCAPGPSQRGARLPSIPAPPPPRRRRRSRARRAPGVGAIAADGGGL